MRIRRNLTAHTEIKSDIGDAQSSSRLMASLDFVKVREGERGAGHFKAIFWTLVLVSIIYVGFKVVPVLVNNYQFQDGIQNIARFTSVNHSSPDAIKKSVLEEAQKDDLPIQADDIKVQSGGRKVGISVDYSVTVDLKVYQWTLNFHPSASNEALF
jgi:uncharacterized protein DUF4845